MAYSQQPDKESAFSSVVDRFDAQARLSPDACAVVCADDRLTYQALQRQSEVIAARLRARGIGRGDVIGLCLDRSCDLVAALLGVLKSGAAYAPLDPTYPPPRLRAMIRQVATMRWVVSAPATRSLIEGEDLSQLDIETLAGPEEGRELVSTGPQIGPDDIGYVVFTSGSTGQPKAVAVRHGGWANLLGWLLESFGLDRAASNLFLSSFGFDISQRSLMAPLLSGATLHLLPGRHFDPLLARRLISRHGVRSLHCAPSALYLLVDAGAGEHRTLKSLRHVFVGGEPLAPVRIRDWLQSPQCRCRLVNVYGVAECTDVSIAHCVQPAEYAAASVPIGRPITRTCVHLLDDHLKPVETGEAGEICISGAGVGAGYIGNADLTAQRFVKLRRNGVDLDLYRTGDLGRMRADGVYLCIGRLDDQVKVRGMRIDLGDVEAALRAHVAVADAAAAVVETDGAPALHACIVATQAAVGPAMEDVVRRVRSDLSRSVPRHMVPDYIRVLPALPLNPNGKVDRAAVVELCRLGVASVVGEAV